MTITTHPAPSTTTPSSWWARASSSRGKNKIACRLLRIKFYTYTFFSFVVCYKCAVFLFRDRFFPGVIFIAKATKNPKLILDGNEFVTHVIGKRRTRWRCNAYFRTRCLAALQTKGKVVKVMGTHNHEASLKDVDYQALTAQNVYFQRS